MTLQEQIDQLNQLGEVHQRIVLAVYRWCYDPFEWIMDWTGEGESNICPVPDYMLRAFGGPSESAFKGQMLLLADLGYLRARKGELGHRNNYYYFGEWRLPGNHVLTVRPNLEVDRCGSFTVEVDGSEICRINYDPPERLYYWSVSDEWVQAADTWYHRIDAGRRFARAQEHMRRTPVALEALGTELDVLAEKGASAAEIAKYIEEWTESAEEESAGSEPEESQPTTVIGDETTCERGAATQSERDAPEDAVHGDGPEKRGTSLNTASTDASRETAGRFLMEVSCEQLAEMVSTIASTVESLSYEAWDASDERKKRGESISSGNASEGVNPEPLLRMMTDANHLYRELSARLEKMDEQEGTDYSERLGRAYRRHVAALGWGDARIEDYDEGIPPRDLEAFREASERRHHDDELTLDDCLLDADDSEEAVGRAKRLVSVCREIHAELAERQTLEVDEERCEVRWRGKTCRLRNTQAFRLMKVLAEKPGALLTHDQLKDRIRSSSKQGVIQAKNRLDKALRESGMHALANAIESEPESYRLDLP